MHEEMRDALNKQNETLDRIERLTEDSAQTARNSATLLHGAPEYGIRGFIPETLERMSAIEAKQVAQDRKVDERHEETSGRLDKIEANQGRIRRCVDAVYKWTSGPEGKTHRHWIWVLFATLMTWLLTFVSDHMGWYWGRKLLHLFAR